MSNHNSRASGGSRPADNTGRWPEVLAGVCPMINMQRGETRDSFLAGIAEHNTGRWPEVLAGVCPMINMQRGETRDSFLAGIAEHDGGCVLSSGFHRQRRVVPPVLRGENI